MCIGISCEIGRHGDEIVIWFGDPSENGPDRDSHTIIRKFNRIPEIYTDNWRRTPIELWLAGDWKNANDYKINFDESKPDWWDLDCESALRSRLKTEINLRRKSVEQNGLWPGSVKVVGKSAVEWTSVGGYLDVHADFSAPVLTSVGGYLDVYANFSAPVLEKVNGKPYKK